MSEFGSDTVSVLILARNEAANLEDLLPDVRRVLNTLGVEPEVIVVDAASTDGTSEVAARLGARVIQQSGPGYANALREGLAECRGAYVLAIDADQSHRPGFVVDLLAERHNAEIVIASRYVDGGSADMSPSRRVLSILLNRTFARLLRIPLKDMSSGFRLYNRAALEILKPLGVHFDVLPEIAALATLAGLRVKEIPFHYQPRKAGVSKARVLKFGPSYVRTLVRCLLANTHGTDPLIDVPAAAESSNGSQDVMPRPTRRRPA